MNPKFGGNTMTLILMKQRIRYGSGRWFTLFETNNLPISYVNDPQLTIGSWEREAPEQLSHQVIQRMFSLISYAIMGGGGFLGFLSKFLTILTIFYTSSKKTWPVEQIYYIFLTSWLRLAKNIYTPKTSFLVQNFTGKSP